MTLICVCVRFVFFTGTQERSAAATLVSSEACLLFLSALQPRPVVTGCSNISLVCGERAPEANDVLLSGWGGGVSFTLLVVAFLVPAAASSSASLGDAIVGPPVRLPVPGPGGRRGVRGRLVIILLLLRGSATLLAGCCLKTQAGVLEPILSRSGLPRRAVSAQ